MLNANSAIFQQCHGEDKLIFNDKIMRSALFQTSTLSSFRTNQSFLFLFNAACLAEKQHITILQFLVLPDRGSNPQSTTLEVSTITITLPMLLSQIRKKIYKTLLIALQFDMLSIIFVVCQKQKEEEIRQSRSLNTSTEYIPNKCSAAMKRNFHSEGQQFHQYQLSENSPNPKPQINEIY